MKQRWSAATGLMPVAACLFVYPFLWIPLPRDSFHYPKYIGLVVIALICTALLLRRLSSFRGLLAAVPRWRVGLIGFALIIASALLSPDPAVAVNGGPYRHTGLLTYLCLAAVFVYCLDAVKAKDSRFLLTLFFLSGVILAVIAAIQFSVGVATHTIVSLNVAQRNSFAATAGNVNFLAAYLLMAGIAGIAVAGELRRKPLALAGLFAIQLMIILSLCRGVWVAELFVVPWLWRMQKPRTMALGTLAVIGILAVLFVCSEAARSRLALFAHLPTRPNLVASDRIYFWQNSLNEFRHSSVKEFLIGSGPDTFRARVPDLYGKARVVDKPHNVYLDYLLCLGLPATVMVLIFVGGLCLAPKRSELSRYVSLIFLAYGVQAFFSIDAILLLPSQAIFLALLAVEARNDGEVA